MKLSSADAQSALNSDEAAVTRRDADYERS